MLHTRNLLALTFTLVLGIAAWGQTMDMHPAKTATMSKQQLLTLIATAKTPTQQERLAQYYTAQAQQYAALANEHAQMAEQYKKNPWMGANKHFASTYAYCASLAQSFQKLSGKMEQLAKAHEQMAHSSALK
jgi:hypothetical protein